MAQPLEFDKALKQARLAEAFHLDAVANVKDARGLRLQALKDALLPSLQEHPAAREFLELRIEPGESPRLWIDLISSVIIEPDTRIYRFEQDLGDHRSTILETEELDSIKNHVLRYLAHRVLARERTIAGLSKYAAFDNGQKYGLAALVYAWVTGAALATLALLGAAMLLGKLKF